MASGSLAKLFGFSLRNCRLSSLRQCHSIFNLKELLTIEKPEFDLQRVSCAEQTMALDMVKRLYLTEHVLVRDREVDLGGDSAVDEYIASLIKQGNTICAKSEDGRLAGICVGFASSPVDARKLRTYAFYRQDPNTKDFFYFTAKLQETPNIWEIFKQQKIFEIKMLAVVPEFRRLGLAASLVEASKTMAHDQGYHVIRMDCINPYDYKIAERCMLHCIIKFPLHRLRGAHAPFVRQSSPHNCCVRVYVGTRPQANTDATGIKAIKEKHRELEDILE